MNKRITFLFAICLITALQPAFSQRNGDTYFDVSVSPSLGFQILGGIKLPQKYSGSESTYRDSISKISHPGQSMNFGVQYFSKKNAFNAFSIGLSYTTLTFRRTQQNLILGDMIHPKVGIVSGLIQAANLTVKHDFRYKYIEVPLLWHKSAEGYGNLKEFDIWYFGGFAPAVLVRDRVHIFTEGFTTNGTNTFNVKDDDITPVRFNIIGQAGIRADYYMYKNLHGLLQPRIRVPLLPSTGGIQSVWIPQLSVDLGLIFLLDKTK